MDKENVQECPTPTGILLIIGGHENKGEEPESQNQKEHPSHLEVLKLFVKHLNHDDPVVEVITSAGGEPNASFREYLRAFKELGLNRINHLFHSTREDVMNDEAALERIGKADGIFFTGGDQLKLTSLYGGTELLYNLKKRYIDEPVVIAGTSAGAMALSTPMICAGNEEVQQLTGEIKVTTGLEFLKDVCIDTHFTDRNRFVRMAQVIASNPTCIGIGIGEDTAMLVKNGHDATFIGSGIVIVIDGFHLSSSNIIDFGEKQPLSVQNLKVHLFIQGDTYTIPLANPRHL